MTSYRLRTLGGVGLESESGSKGGGAASQRRTLALLVLIAAAGERGIARDRLLAYLWPESEPEKARHTLTQSLYALRRDLKADELFLGTTELRLNRELVAMDALEMEAALDRGDLAAAVDLYAGPFLDGFFLANAPEFERWTDGERRRLAARVAQALELLAGHATKHEDHAAAVAHWRRLAAMDPFSSRVAIALMRSMAAAGDRAGALQHARLHETLLRSEMELEPDPELVKLTQMLREEVATATTLPPIPRQQPAATTRAPAPPLTPAPDAPRPSGLLRRSSAILAAFRRTAPRRLLTSTTRRVAEVAAAEKEMAARTHRRRVAWIVVGAVAVLLTVAIALAARGK